METLKGKYEAGEAIINNAKAKAFAGKIKKLEQSMLIGEQVDMKSTRRYNEKGGRRDGLCSV